MDKLEEYRIFGPPGTGKTSSLIVNIAEAARILREQLIATCGTYIPNWCKN